MINKENWFFIEGCLNYYQKLDALAKIVKNIETIGEEDIEEINRKIDEINEDINNISISINNLSTFLNKLIENYNSQYHLVEIFDVTITPEQFNNQDKSVVLENELYKLVDSIVSWSPRGSKNDITNISECGLFLNEQTEEGKIKFTVDELPLSNVNIKITVQLIGTATDEEVEEL